MNHQNLYEKISKDKLFSIPQELKQIDSWICFQLIKGEKKDQKIPKWANSKKAYGFSTAEDSDVEPWAYYQACEALSENPDLHGLGFLFKKNGIVGIDLDNCFDENGNLTQFASDILSLFPGCYTEYSVSGKGLHILCSGTIAAAIKTEKIEVYDTARFFTMTGNLYRAGALLDCQETLDTLSKIYLAPISPANRFSEIVGEYYWSTDRKYKGGQQTLISTLESLEKTGIEVIAEKQKKDWKYYYLSRCPFDRHTTPQGAKDTAVCISDEGALAFTCFHASCGKHSWKELKTLLKNKG